MLIGWSSRYREYSLNIMKCLAQLILFSRRVYRRLLITAQRPTFRMCDRNVWYDPYGLYSCDNIEIGNDVFIGPGAHLQSSVRTIKVGNKVMFGPNVTILRRDHNTGVVGKFMYDVKVKLPDNDLPVVLEDDVWVGSRAILLKCVTLGRGPIAAAGFPVRTNVAPFTVVGGVPARRLKVRFSLSQALQHEEALYPPEHRIQLPVLEVSLRDGP